MSELLIVKEMNHTRNKSPLILVADDDRATRILLRIILNQDRYQIIEVENGQECLSVCKKYLPDMILLDAIMPVMDGFTCCQTLKTEPLCRSIPVLMITALEDQASVDRAFEAGAIDYITKPIHPPVLRQRLKRLFEVKWASVALQASEAKYRTVVNSLKEVIFQTDTRGKLTFLNPAWEEITGFSIEESLNQNISQFIYGRDRLLHIQQFESLKHKNHCQYQIRYQTRHNNVGWMEVYASQMLDSEAALTGITGIINDITERKRREQYQKAEHGTTKILAESQTLKQAIPWIIEMICHSLGWDLGEFWQFSQAKHCLSHVAIWHSQPDQFGQFQQSRQQISFNRGEGLPGYIWAKGESVWLTNIDQDNHILDASVVATGFKTAFGFPIKSGKQLLGVMNFFSVEVQFQVPDLLAMIAAISSQISQFIQRRQAEKQLQQQNQLLQSELYQAAEYVRSLLPSPLQQNLNIQQQFVPSAQLGGDIFDYYWLDPHHLVFYLLDVAGHGVKSALLSTSILNLLRSQSLYNTNFYEPWTVLAELNRVFQMNQCGDNYFTIWYGVYDLVKRELVYACAGHPPAILIADTAQSTKIQPLSTDNIPIGMLSDFDFDQSVCQIQPGSTIYLFSDGVYEIPLANGQLWGIDAFINLINQYHKQNIQDLNKVYRYIKKQHQQQILDDDFSLLTIKF